MKSFDTELQKHAEKIRLKAAERRELRERILSYMEYHPLPKRESSPLLAPVREVRHEPYFFVPFSALSVRVTGGVFAALLFIVVPLMAERSVPGDVLYLVKTGVNEGIQGTLANSPYEKVTFETKLIERRLAEARLLASEGKLTSDVEAQIIETVQGHASAVQTSLAELRESDAEGAAIAEIVVGSALEVQSTVLGVNNSTEADSSVVNLLAAVNTMRDEVEMNPESTVPSFDGLSGRIESETTRSHELFEAIKNSATNEEVADIERGLADIDRKIVAAKELRATDETGSVTELIDALSLIQKLITFMTDINVRATVTLDALVPVVLTPEERTAALTTTLEELAKRRGPIDAELLTETDADILEKVTPAVATLDALMLDAVGARDAGAIDVAEGKLAEAVALTVDLEALLHVSELPVLPVEGATSTSETGTTTESVTPEDGTTIEESGEEETTTPPTTEATESGE